MWRWCGAAITPSRLAWLGLKAPLPAPASAATANACQGARAAANSAKAIASTASEPMSTHHAEKRSTSAPPAGAATTGTTLIVARISPAVPSENPRTSWK
jgi:hypothetical protein